LKRVCQNRSEVALLLEEQEKMKLAGKDPAEFREKLRELKEMADFYDSLREVLEELGGVKICTVREDNETRQLYLTILIYEQHKVEIQMEVYRKTALKVVNAKWLTNPVVTNRVASEDQREQFSLTMAPLDDLVQVAKTSMGPRHDVWFIIRETCARIRIFQDRVDDLAILRRLVLTKVVGNDQVLCSLNEGIVIVMRLYDQWVQVEQIVGMNGLDKATTDKIHLKFRNRDESLKPTSVLEVVKNEIARLQKEEGLVLPQTPVLPKRKEINNDGQKGEN